MVYLFEFNLIIIILTAAHLGQNRFGPKQAKQVNRKKAIKHKISDKNNNNSTIVILAKLTAKVTNS